MRLINREEIDKYIDFNDIYKATKIGFIKFSKGQTITPPFTLFKIPENNGSVHLKYGYVIGEESFSLKYSGAFYENEKLGLDNFLGLFVVFNAKTGEVELIIDDKGFLTDYRTGIAGAIATERLARKNSKIVAVIGTGMQARMQIKSLMNVNKNIEELNIYGRNNIKAQEYYNEMKKIYPDLILNIFDNPNDAVKNADIIYTVTHSEKPIIKSEWIKEGTHITAVGACSPDMQELEEDLFEKANIVVADSKISCSTYGEIHHAIEKNTIKLDDVIELGEILENGIDRKDEDITICDLVGLGFQDAVIGNCIYKKIKN